MNVEVRIRNPGFAFDIQNSTPACRQADLIFDVFNA
jgi:hypothetical protein